METKQIISWLLDKAARAQDHSYARMLNQAAKRLRELEEKVDKDTNVLTNGDWIRQMTDEELAEWFGYTTADTVWDELGKRGVPFSRKYGIDAGRQLLEWMKQPAEVDHES